MPGRAFGKTITNMKALSLTKGVEEEAGVEHESVGGPAYQQETRDNDQHTLHNGQGEKIASQHSSIYK